MFITWDRITEHTIEERKIKYKLEIRFRLLIFIDVFDHRPRKHFMAPQLQL